MKTHTFDWSVLPAVVVLGILTVNPAHAEEFEEFEIFFEFNSTDLDMGIQVFLDGEPWEDVTIKGPDGEILEVEADGELGDLGETELFTESAEPQFADPDTATEEEIEQGIQAFLDRFAAGRYRAKGKTIDGRRIRGVAELTHNLLDPPELDTSSFPTVSWVPDPDAVRYEIVIEAEVVIIEDGEEEELVFVNTATLGPMQNEFTASEEFLDMLDEFEDNGAEVAIKAELICEEESGNKTISEEQLDD